MSTNSHSVRVVVRLPYNRPHDGYDNPVPVDWNAEKEATLWDVVNRSRQRDSAMPDWQGLSAYLNVPLPYLLYRARQRFEEDLKGLGVGVTRPNTVQLPQLEEQIRHGERPELTRKTSTRTVDTIKMSSSFRIGSPRIARARLNSLGSGSGPKHMKHLSSSTQTLQIARNRMLPQTQDSSPSDSDPESEEEAERADAEQRRAEEEETLEQKLKHLQSIMTSENLGFVRGARTKTKGKSVQRGRDLQTATSPSPLRQTFQRRDLSSSDFHSNNSSPHGSIPSIPSPSDSLPQSPTSRQPMSSRRTSGPTVKSHRPIAVEIVKKDQESNQGSSASSFDSLSDASTSVLEGVLQSQPGTSKLSQFTNQLTSLSSYRRSFAGL